MSLGLVGRKVGMTRIFADDGASIPVTVLDVSNNRVTQVKSPEVDGYAAIQVTFGQRRASRVSKPQAGHLAKPGTSSRNSASMPSSWPHSRLAIRLRSPSSPKGRRLT